MGSSEVADARAVGVTVGNRLSPIPVAVGGTTASVSTVLLTVTEAAGVTWVVFNVSVGAADDDLGGSDWVFANLSIGCGDP